MFFIFVVILCSALYFLPGKRYEHYIEPLNPKEFPLKKLLHAGFYIMDLAGLSFSTRHDRKLLMQTAEVYGHKYSRFYLRVHWANKIVSMLVGLAAVAFISACSGSDGSIVILFAPAVPVVIFLVCERDLAESVKKRRLSVQLDLPDFVNKLALLVNAGMTSGRALEKIIVENTRRAPLYQELEVVLADIRGGKSEAAAYEDLAKRCRLPDITKFSSVMIQNSRKGSTELVPVLRLQAADCWEHRKHTARRIGEEASTRLLLPMMIMFVAILIIVAVPAILAMQGV